MHSCSMGNREAVVRIITGESSTLIEYDFVTLLIFK